MSDHPIDERYEVAAEVMALRAELDRLNAQALELCAEISGLRRELTEANAVIADAAERLKATVQPPVALEEYFCPNCANAGCTDCTPSPTTAARLEALRELAQQSQELGLYDTPTDQQSVGG